MLRFAFFATVLISSGLADAHQDAKNCPDGKKHYRATIRHIESGGIGYDNGYTTLEAFLASDPSQWRITPFLDVRGHIFDNGRWAANAGIGLRALWGDRAYGINTYYDYRSTGRLTSNQIGAGLETFGELFDFRINGYLPLGTKTSSPYNAAFANFSGNYMYVSETYQSAMKGGNAEFGFHFGRSESFDFYAAAGPYYFIGEVAPAIWGGKARLSGTYKDIVTLEVSDSYDRTFHNKFQGQISLSFSFGPKSKIKEHGRTCKAASTLNNRMLQPIERQEIIVIDNARKNTVAIDPATGLPYFFVFVDNTSSSNGTFESPYHTLAQSQANSGPNDIIYVFPGDGTTTGMADGITLQASQKFWGSGISHPIQTSVGTISIPAQSSSSPTITNTNVDTEGNAITLASNNAISGFTIASALNDAIYGADSQSLDVSFCTIQNTATYTIEAIFPDNASVSVTNNQFLNNVNGIFLTLNGTSGVACLNNVFTGQSSVSSIPLSITANDNTFTTQIQNNLFNNNTAGSILFALNSVGNASIRIIGNTLTDNDTGTQSSLASNVAIIPGGTTDYCSVVLKGNVFSGNTSNAFYLHTSGDEITTLEVTASANTVFNHGGSGLVLATPVGNLTLLATNNTIASCNDNGIAVIAAGHSSTGNIIISNNTITDIGTMLAPANGIAVTQDFSTLSVTIQNNEIHRCEATGILAYAPTQIDSLTLNISDNTINDCQNRSGNAASGISFDTHLTLTAVVANNTLLDDVTPAVAIGTLSSGDPDVCLTLIGNDCNTNLLETSYALTNSGSGIFYLSPCNVDAINVGTLSIFGTVDAVVSCPDAVPCPP